MKHAELNDLWIHQYEQYQSWNESLAKQSKLLLDEVKNILQPPTNTWQDHQNRIRRYVELYDICEDEPKPLYGLSYGINSISDNGELKFGIAVTFEAIPGGFPKKTSYISLGVRFKNKEPQYSFLNLTTREPESQWETDIRNFAESLIDRIVYHLKFDPFDGLKTPASIGFI